MSDDIQQITVDDPGLWLLPVTIEYLRENWNESEAGPIKFFDERWREDLSEEDMPFVSAQHESGTGEDEPFWLVDLTYSVVQQREKFPKGEYPSAGDVPKQWRLASRISALLRTGFDDLANRLMLASTDGIVDPESGDPVKDWITLIRIFSPRFEWDVHSADPELVTNNAHLLFRVE